MSHPDPSRDRWQLEDLESYLRDRLRVLFGGDEDHLVFAPGGPRRLLSLEEQDALPRESPDELCVLCWNRYADHFVDVDYLNHEGRPFLRTLCDGRVVKI